MKKNMKIGMSLALATALSLGVSACGSSDNNAAVTPASTATDVTVERGKVYDATVTDSSTPVQVATQKVGKNVYTFAKAPTYPVIANGGWIDVNDDGKMDASDVKLDIEMKSYGTTVTPITTVMATFATKSERDEALQSLADELNTANVGSDTIVTVSDLLKVPSDAPRDVMVVSNATFKDMKENNTSQPALSDVMSQFSTIYGGLSDTATAADIEQVVMSSLESQGDIVKVSQEEILAYIDAHKKPVVTPPTTEGTTSTDDTTTTGGSTTLDLNGYSSIIIYNNISETTASTMMIAFKNNPSFESSKTTSPSSCKDYGFTVKPVEGGYMKTYTETNLTTYSIRTCTEYDYNNIAYSGGSANYIAYYGN